MYWRIIQLDSRTTCVVLEKRIREGNFGVGVVSEQVAVTLSFSADPRNPSKCLEDRL